MTPDSGTGGTAGEDAGGGGGTGGAGGAGGTSPGSGGTEAGVGGAPPEAGPDVTVLDCPGDGTCSSHGACDTSSGSCKCAEGYDGVTCDGCAIDYVGYPDCYQPQSCPSSCSGFGTCNDKTGQCTCDPVHAGPACDTCAPGYVGYPACVEAKPCPGNCSGHGTCDGLTGVCSCEPEYSGPACNECTTGHFAFVPLTTLAVHNPANVALGDTDADGDLDLAVANWDQPTITTYRGHGTGLFSAKTELAAKRYPSDLRMVDLNADGLLDLVGDMDGDKDDVGYIGVFLNVGAGQYGPMSLLQLPGDVSKIDTGDVNRDDRPDIVAVSVFTDPLFALHNDGTGSFGVPVQYPGGTHKGAVAVGDLDGDGWNDVAVTDGYSIGIRLNQPGGLGSMTKFPLVTPAEALAIADLDGDARPELVVTDLAGGVSMFRNQGNAVFTLHGEYATGAGAISLRVADLDRDGSNDVVIGGFWKGGTTILINAGNGTFVDHGAVASGTSPHELAVGDVNQDGRPDLVIGNANDNEVAIHLNECVP